MPWILALVLLSSAQPANERPPQAQELLAYPPDGAAVPVTPPGFTWTPNDRAASYRLEVFRRSVTVIRTGSLRSTAFAPPRKLTPGQYSWRVVYVNPDGTDAGVSRTRRFTIPADARPLPMPDVQALQRKLAAIRPRMFLSGHRLQRLRTAVRAGLVPEWPRMLAAAEAALAEQLYPEPALYDKSKPSSAEWLRTFTPGKAGSAHVARLALAAAVTGEERYLEAARRWMVHIASWDPRGITSHGLKLRDGNVGNDEASMPILERMSFAWDWIGDKLPPADRRRILESMTERGNQVLRKLDSDDFLTHPFNNHSGRALAFLGEAGLSFLGDIPDAARWLDYVLRCYLTSYPSWGGDPGGWAQGISYWSFYVYNQVNFAEALRAVSEVDLMRRPFYRNTGYFGLYFHPPYAPRGAFGDGGYHPPSEVEGLLVDYLAEANRDPVLKWHAQGIARAGQKNTNPWREWYIEDVVGTWRAAEASTLKAEFPARLAGSRYWPDIGWAAMHSALGDAANDVWMMFKSSRYGSFSHSHGDQNTFQFNAYGQALAIDSGYYPSYGTPHDELWTRQTRAHNGILIEGRGQPPHTWDASGEIESFEHKGDITIVRGQAAKAYNIPQSPSDTRLWLKLLKEPLPPMTPRLEDFSRTVAFVASPTRPVAFVYDCLRAERPAAFSWLLHALNRMEVNSWLGSITIRQGHARLAVRLVATVPVTMSQRKGFPVPPEKATNTAYILGEETYPDQWHLSGLTGAKAAEAKFLAVMVPYRESEPQPEISGFESNGTRGFRVAGVEASAAWTPGAGKLSVRSGPAGR